MRPGLLIGVAVDKVGWHARVIEGARASGLPYEVFDIERSDWVERVGRYSAVLWRPNLDPPYCEEGKEKIYFMERCLGIRVFPNWATFWHYDNKRAQAYILQSCGIATPDTFCSFSQSEAMAYIGRARFPLISKNAGGASSESVRLLRNAREAQREIRVTFREPLSCKILRRLGAQVRWRPTSMRSYVLWQEFIAGNDRDLRITIIGQKYGFAFWRKNRVGDFRASGSGLIDYDAADRRSELSMCLELCRQQGFDSMAFDIVYRGGKPVILEMSYAFNDKAIFNAPGHFVSDNDAEGLVFHEGHVWPQGLQLSYVADCLTRDRAVPHAPTGSAGRGWAGTEASPPRFP